VTVALVEMADVHKRFGGVVALAGASLSAEAGELHALIGPNGSGKSTLNKTLTGVVAPDRAEIKVDGRPVAFRGPQEAQAVGISAVYQELSLVGDLTVAENVGLGVEPTRLGFLDRDEQRRRVHQVLERFASAFEGRLPLDRPVASLTSAERQIVEIGKAIARNPRILVLDEATASLHQAQVQVLFEVVRELRDRGVLVIFTSHRLDEVFALCERATVLRGGKNVRTVDLTRTTESELVTMMLGHALEQPERPRPQEIAARPAVLEVHDLTTARLRGISFQLREGEILGVGGLVGQGQSELLSALFGAARVRGGEIRLNGSPVRLHGPRQAARAGIALIPGDRAREGLFGRRPILENLTLPSAARRTLAGILRNDRERRAAGEAVRRLRIKLRRLEDAVSTLSGGNQQKVVVGKWLLTEPRIVLMDDPTKGIDVAAKEELYESMRSLADLGVGILFHSTDNLELVEYCARVLVLFEGRVVATLEGDDLTEDRLLSASMRVDQAVP
jgi:ribose transport system ATP-binding protein